MKITAKQYAQTLYDLTEGKSKPEIEKSALNFARYIYKERKLKLAEKIIEQFEVIYNKEKGIIAVEVMTREKINEPLEQKIKHFIKEKYLAYRQAGQAKEVHLKNIVDENIKGGLVLKVGDEIIDGSIRGRLDSLKNIITR